MGTITNISYRQGCQGISVVLLQNNKVFVTFSANQTYSTTKHDLLGVICTISGEDISINNTLTSIYSTSSNGSYISGVNAIALSSSKVFIAFNYSSSHILSGVICTVDSNNNITVGTVVTESVNAYMLSITLLSSNKIFISYNYETLYGIICNISGTTISFTAKTLLIANCASSQSGLVTLSNNKVFVTYTSKSGTTPSGQFGLFCEIKDNSINIISNILLSSETPEYNLFTAMLSLMKILYVNTTYGILINILKLIDNLTSTEDKILGIANTSGTEGETIEVYVPEEVSV